MVNSIKHTKKFTAICRMGVDMSNLRDKLKAERILVDEYKSHLVVADAMLRVAKAETDYFRYLYNQERRRRDESILMKIYRMLK